MSTGATLAALGADIAGINLLRMSLLMPFVVGEVDRNSPLLVASPPSPVIVVVLVVVVGTEANAPLLAAAASIDEASMLLLLLSLLLLPLLSPLLPLLLVPMLEPTIVSHILTAASRDMLCLYTVTDSPVILAS
jgi:hypothetical protein